MRREGSDSLEPLSSHQLYKVTRGPGKEGRVSSLSLCWGRAPATAWDRAGRCGVSHGGKIGLMKQPEKELFRKGEGRGSWLGQSRARHSHPC